MNDVLLAKLDKINNNFSSMLSKFVIDASNLVELSEDDYQIEKTFKLNKISLKGFVLESPCCVLLKDKGFNDYSIDELKSYLIQYENQFNEDCYKYQLALRLYELIEEMETLYDLKIQCELDIVKQVVRDIKDIQSIEKSQYEQYYWNWKSLINGYCVNNQLNESILNMYLLYLNDICSYHLNGYPAIPEEYIKQNNDL